MLSELSTRLTSHLSRLFNRSPATGERKDPAPMPDSTPQNTTPAPQNAPDVAAHLAALAEAMRQLAESHKSLAELVKPTPAASRSPTPDISGDPAGGTSPAALNAVDYSKLSPLQQITLGLRDAARTPSPRAGAD